jgi:hypothetical protein
MIIPLNVELHMNFLTEEETAGIVARANDREALGVDDLAEPITDLADALAELLMFDPTWLFGSRVVAGWTAEPVRE